MVDTLSIKKKRRKMATPPPAIIPAQLGFLAIYNPSLGTTDETLDDQIVYYASLATLSGPRRKGNRNRNRRREPSDDDGDENAATRNERNERLRQIGLAQAMVEFGRGFSQGRAVDTVETEKGRVVLHELEPGWWILAVGFTFLPCRFFLRALLTNPSPST